MQRAGCSRSHRPRARRPPSLCRAEPEKALATTPRASSGLGRPVPSSPAASLAQASVLRLVGVLDRAFAAPSASAFVDLHQLDRLHRRRDRPFGIAAAPGVPLLVRIEVPEPAGALVRAAFVPTGGFLPPVSADDAQATRHTQSFRTDPSAKPPDGAVAPAHVRTGLSGEPGPDVVEESLCFGP